MNPFFCRVKKIKYFLCGLWIMLLIVNFSNTLCAHSGGVDSQGGHYDHSTGEYHFHHGCPPHDHVDGICPYDFKDCSNKSDRTSTYNEGNTIPNNETYPEKNDIDNYSNSAEDSSDDTFFHSIISFLFLGGILLVPVLLSILIDFVSSKIDDKRQKHLQEIEAIKREEKRKELMKMKEEKRNELMNIYSGEDLLQLANAPSNLIIENNMIMNWNGTMNQKYYISSNGYRYHEKFGCSKAMREIDTITAKCIYSPCRKCVSSDEDFSWIFEYQRLNKICSEYEIDAIHRNLEFWNLEERIICIYSDGIEEDSFKEWRYDDVR